MAIDLWNFQQEQEQLAIAEATRPIVLAEVAAKESVRSEFAIKDFELDARSSFATVAVEKHPEWVRQQLAETEELPPAETQTGSENFALKDSDLKTEPENEPEDTRFFQVELPIAPDFGIEFFDWRQFHTQPENYSHLRFVAPTNGGKTTLADWLMDVVPCDRKFVCSIKRKPHQWRGLDVIGIPEDYDAIRHTMLSIQSERIRRTALMAKGIDFPAWNIGFDEWKAIARNIKAIVDRPTKQVISPSARDLQGENLTLGRELKLRIFALAQGRQVITWGLEGESDLAECFCSIYMGKFAVEECESYRNKYPKDSEQYAKYDRVRNYLVSLGKLAAWINSEDGEYPAIVPDLSKWKRETAIAILSPGCANDTNKQPESKPELEPKMETQNKPPTATNPKTYSLEDARKMLKDIWEVDFTESEITSPSTSLTPPPSEVQEVRHSNALDNASLLPGDVRSKALGNILRLLGEAGSTSQEVIKLIPENPDRAVWLGIKLLGKSMTATSRDVFGCGVGGKKFQKAKNWFELLEKEFDNLES